jgi:hypothetical protein
MRAKGGLMDIFVVSLMVSFVACLVLLAAFAGFTKTPYARRIIEADLHWSAIRTGPILACPEARSFAVTPPDEGTQLRVRWAAGPVCRGGRIDVRPIRR